MDDILLVIFGFIGGLVVGILIGFSIIITGSPSLDDCAKENNVYQCELVAVPVSTN